MNKILLLVLSIAFSISAQASVRKEKNPCIPDVAQSVSRLAQVRRSDLALRTNGQVPGLFYTRNPAVDYGLENHFQGVQRLGDSNFVVISGAIKQEKLSQLFVVQMGSRSADGDFQGNLSGSYTSPPEEDKIIAHIDLKDPVFWHAGGLARLGDILAVPFEENENHRSSSIWFYDFANPSIPVKIPVEINRANAATSAVGLERLRDGRFILAALDSNRLDFYYSKTTRFEDGFMELAVSVPGFIKADVGGQGVSLVQQCDGKLFYANFDNNGSLPPIINGQDVMKLHEVNGITGSYRDAISLQTAASVPFACGSFCNFSASAGVYVGSDQHMRLYSTAFYRDATGVSIPFAEFAE